MFIWKKNRLEPLTSYDFIGDLQSGYGLFETMLVTKNKGIILYNEHIDRLKRGLSLLNAKKLDYDFEKLRSDLTKRLDKFDYYRLKLMYLPSKSNLLIFFKEFLFNNKNWALYSNPKYFRGHLPHYKMKSVSYMENFFFKNMAESLQFDDYLIIDYKGNICETTMANIFFVKNRNTIETPPSSDNALLDGTIRSYIIKTKIPEINIIEKNIKLSEIASYKEVFITNSLRLAQNVIQINDVFYDSNIISNKIRGLLVNKLLA